MPSGRSLPPIPSVTPRAKAVVPPPFSGTREQGRKSEPALWRQIADAMRAPIESGAWQPGARLPIEAELAVHFRVNRHTVRQALDALVHDGLIAKAQGKGTFVTGAERLRFRLEETGPFDALADAPDTPLRMTFIGQRLIEAGTRLGSDIGVDPTARAAEIALRLSLNELPLSLATIWVGEGRFAHFADALRRHGSFAPALGDYGIHQWQTRRSLVRSRLADARESDLLQAQPPVSLTVVESALEQTGQGGGPFCRVRHVLCAQRVGLEIGHAQGAA